MKTNFTHTQIIFWGIMFLFLLIFLFPHSRNYVIHKFNSVSHHISPRFSHWLKNDLECEVVANPISQDELMHFFPYEYENIMGFQYDIKIRNISSAYIKLDPVAETSVYHSDIPYVHFVSSSPERLTEISEEEYKNRPPDLTPEEEEKWRQWEKERLAQMPRGFGSDRLKKWEEFSYHPTRYFYKNENISGREQYVVNFYVDYYKNFWWQRAKFCRVIENFSQ